MDAPVGALNRCLSLFPMASLLSIGREIQSPGVDQRWVRIWLLDAAARPPDPCQLVARAVDARLARKLQAACGDESPWGP